MSTPMMTAAHVTSLGPAHAIRVGSLPVPQPGPAEVLVRVTATAVNPVDTYIRSGRYPTQIPFPFVLGRDLAGTVSRVGADVTRFRPGDVVWSNSLGHDGRQGSFAEYAVVPAERLYRLPDGVDPEVAAAVAHPAATAYLGWIVHGRLRQGQTVYVGGGAGNVGTAAIQVARLAGARVLASARPEDHQHCRAAGADVVFDYRDTHVAEELTEHAPDGVDILWDTSGRQDLGLAATATAVGARIIVTSSMTSEATLPLRLLYTRDVSVVGFVISRADVGDLAGAAALINRMLADGLLTTRIADRLPLADTARAHHRVETGHVSGRLVVRP